jgi:hypothetical protein
MILQTAYCSQRGTDEAPWKVYSSPDHKVIYDLEEIGRLDASTAMSYVHFGRKFEKKAYYEGMEVGTKNANAISTVEIDVLTRKNEFLEQENIKLSAVLENIMENENI